MTTVFGKGLRGRRKAAEDDGEVATIADAANLWWTRRDFVQHAVVLTESPRQPGSPGPEADLTASRSTAPTDAPRQTPAASGRSGPATPRHAAQAPGRAPSAPGRAASSRKAAEPPSAPPQPDARTASDPLAGRSFSEVFTTESLFATPGQPDAPRRPAGARTGATRAAGNAAGPRTATARPTATTAPETATEPPPDAPRQARPARKSLAANHPLVGALEHLGLGRDATWREIQIAYRAMAKVAHPDRTGDDGESMALLNAAYTSLRDARSYGLFEDE